MFIAGISNYTAGDDSDWRNQASGFCRVSQSWDSIAPSQKDLMQQWMTLRNTCRTENGRVGSIY